MSPLLNYLKFPDITSIHDYRMQHNMVIKGRRLRVTWIPKCMCTSIKLSMAVAAGVITHEDAPVFIENPHWIHSWVWSLEPKNPIDLADNVECSLVIIRCPSSRMRSAIIEKAIMAPTDADYQMIVQPIAAFFSSYKKIDPCDFTFRHLLEYVRWAPDRMLDIHFLPQIAFLSGHYTHIIPLESFAIVENIFSKYGIELYSVRQHSTQREGRDHLAVRIDDKIQNVREKYHANSDVVIDLDSEFGGEIDSVVAYRYFTDLALWKFSRSIINEAI